MSIRHLACSTVAIQMRRGLATVCVLALALVTSACGGDDDSATTVADNSPTTAEPSPSESITVTAVDFTFQGLPDAIDAGTTFALENDSAAELHELVVLRISGGETRSVDDLVALPQAELQAVFAGPPATVIVAPPGQAGFAALGDGTVPDPGRYLFMCFIPTGVDSDAYLNALEATPGEPPQVPGGPPHFVSGMYQEVTVR